MFICPKCGNKSMQLANQNMYMCTVCHWFRSTFGLRLGFSLRGNLCG